MARKGKTAAELMAELERDPHFLERQRAREEKRIQREQECARLSKPLLTRLSQLGLIGESTYEIARKYAPLPPDAIEILLAAISEVSDVQLKEGIVRAVSAASKPYDGRPLIECYQQTNDEGLKWAILNTVALTSPQSIDDWLATIEDTPAGETLRALRVRK